MRGKACFGITLTFLLIGTLTFAFNIQPVKTSATTIIVPDDYPTIQEAINAASPGDTIYVKGETYYENVVVNKTVSLVGENLENTVIDANGTGTVVLIQADNVTVKGFTIQHGGLGITITGNETKRYVGNNLSENVFKNNAEAILLVNSDSNFVVNNSLLDNGFGIQLGVYIPTVGSYSSDSNTITGNTITSSGRGIWLHNSSHNIVSQNIIASIIGEGIIAEHECMYAPPSSPPVFSNNTINYNVLTNCTIGLSLSCGPPLSSTVGGGSDGSSNNLTGNVVESSELGMYLLDRGNNTIVDNIVRNNVFGILLASESNLLRGNMMIDNTYNFIENFMFGELCNDIDTSNTVNGKSVYYFLNQTGLNINPPTYPDMGFLALINCSDVIIEDMTFSNNGFGITLEGSTNVTITRTMVQDNIVGISACKGSRNNLVGNIYVRNNTIKNNLHGVSVFGAEYATIENNLITNNTNHMILRKMKLESLLAMPFLVQSLIYDESYGISEELLHTAFSAAGILLYGVENSTVIGNSIVTNQNGIRLCMAANNVFRNNNMTGNVYSFGISPFPFFPREWGRVPPDPPQISPYLMNDVDTSNTVNGKPIYWWINQEDKQVPNDAGYVVLVNCTNMVIKDLVLQNNSYGALLVGVSNSLISNNTIKDTAVGIFIHPHSYMNPSTHNTIAKNNITRSGVGIRASSSSSIVSNNLLTNNLEGIYILGDNLTVTENTIANNTNPPLDEWIFRYPLHARLEWGVENWYWYRNGIGIILKGANTTVEGNTIQDNYYGISFYPIGQGYNIIYHNNFINNTEHVFRGLPGRTPVTLPPNTWDNGYPSGGNYWSNYTGVDLHSGFDQDETGSDGIGDTAHEIDEDNIDRYPLMGPSNMFDAGTWNRVAYNVDIISNSTLSDFKLNETQKTLSFNVTGEEDEASFCRITIPNIIVEDLWDKNYTVLLNGVPQPFTNWTDAANTYIYLNYTHSEHEITIIPEFLQTLIFPLFMFFTLVAFALRKKRGMEQQKRGGARAI